MEKIIVSDVDGTLINSDKKINDFDLEMIKKATKNNIGFTIATGRVHTAIKYLIKQLNITIPVSTLNGTVVVDSITGKTIKSHHIEKSTVKKALDIITNQGVNTYYYTSRSLYSTDINSLGYYYLDMNDNLPEDERVNLVEVKDICNLTDENIYKIVAKDEDNKNFDKIRKEISSLENVSFCSSWHDNIEIFSNKGSKGISAKEIAEYMNVDIKNVMVIGDQTNDLSMFETDAFKVAMGNAVDELKERADFVTDDNDNSGLGKAIEIFMKR